MPNDRLEGRWEGELAELREKGTAKGDETVFVKVVPAAGGKGPRYLLAGEGDRPFLRLGWIARDAAGAQGTAFVPHNLRLSGRMTGAVAG